MPGKLIRIVALALALAALTGGSALAQDWGKLMTPTRPLNVRTGRSPSAEKVATIKPGQVVRVDFLKDEWYAVFDPDQKERDLSKALGFSKADYLEPAGPAKWGDVRVVEPKMLNVRKGRGAEFDHVRTLYSGDLVKIDFPRDGWVAVFEPDAWDRDESKAIGYANVKFFIKPTKAQLANLPEAKAPASEVSSVEGKPSPAPAPSSDWGAMVRLEANAKVRKAPDPDADMAAIMVRGDLVKIYGRSGDWLRVFLPQEPRPDSGLALGWAHKDDLGLDRAALDGQPEVMGPVATAEQEPPAPEPAPTPEPVPAPVEEPVPAAPEPAPALSATETFAAAPQTEDREEYVITVPQDAPATPAPVEDPVADQEAHGFRYSLLSVSGQDPLAKNMEIRIWLDVNVVPEGEALRDFAYTIWKRDGSPEKQGTVLIWLPGQDRNSLAYAEARFGPRGQGEFWTRETTLFGTAFK